MKYRNGMIVSTAILLIALFLIPMPAAALHDPEGTQANSGTIYSGNSKMVAFAVIGYSTSVWDIEENEYTGDFDINGDSNDLGAKYVDFYVLIKIKPADSTHKYLEIKADWEFWYGISAGLFCSASWEVRYVIVDMGQNPPIKRGWSEFNPGDSVSYQTKNNQYTDSPDTYYDIYDGLLFNDYYECSTSEWIYAGIWIRTGLNWLSEFYKTTDFGTYADWNTDSISWRFFE